MNILLVNDKPEQLLVLETILESLEQNIIKAYSGEEALRALLCHENIVVILLDVQMPGMHGFETAKLIRQSKRFGTVPIIFTTAKQFSLTDQFAGYATGAIDYVLAPFDADVLRAKIKSLIDLYEKTLQLRLQAQELELANKNLINEVEKREKLEELRFRDRYHLELAEISRVNSMGELASALAHELNQPLTAMTTYTQTCIRKISKIKNIDPKILQSMQLVAEQAERAGSIIHNMKNFIRKGELCPEYLNINDIILKLKPLIEYEAYGTSVSIYYQLCDNLSPTYFDKIQIEQVMLNLIRNAIESLSETHTVVPRLIIKTNQDSQNKIEVRVIDNGPGYPLELADSLFKPYVTTKVKGTGMGLAISYGIIEAHGGKLLASLTPMEGTCFLFTLPIIEEGRSP